MLYLRDYIAYGPKFQHTSWNPAETRQNLDKWRFTNKKPTSMKEIWKYENIGQENIENQYKIFLEIIWIWSNRNRLIFVNIHFMYLDISSPFDVSRFWSIWGDFDFSVGNSVHKQYSLLDTIFNYMFDFGPPAQGITTPWHEHTT